MLPGQHYGMDGVSVHFGDPKEAELDDIEKLKRSVEVCMFDQ